jgi:hypothetical protein
LTQSDPTDEALAAIASILDEQHAPPPLDKAPAEKPPTEEKPAAAEESAAEEKPASATPPPVAHGYFKMGPGPMAALRFKWTVREQDGAYFVDETIGENSTPLVSGPMDPDAAVKFVDDREAEARQRFEDLKHEMSGRAAAASLVRKESSET